MKDTVLEHESYDSRSYAHDDLLSWTDPDGRDVVRSVGGLWEAQSLVESLGRGVWRRNARAPEIRGKREPKSAFVAPNTKQAEQIWAQLCSAHHSSCAMRELVTPSGDQSSQRHIIVD